jgi:hypothetical protein
LSACAPANPQKMAPPETYGQSNQSASVDAKAAFQPKVDILFVIDNSDSMLKHQENLKANINRFVEAFEANKRIDFQIGVTAIWDSRTYGVTSTNFHPLGQLYPLQNGQAPQPGAVGNFVTRAPNYMTVLGNTLKIGTVPYKEGGPEYEELFSPVAAAIDGRNVGFIRPDAHLAVIMITDADDVSSIAPTKLASLLRQAKQGDSSMYSTYAVLSLSSSCPKDPGNRSNSNARILEFLKTSNGQNYANNHAFDLCAANYGAKLAEAGRMIAKQAADKPAKIQLEQIPEDGTLVAKLGGVEIYNDAKKFAGTNKCKYDAYAYTLTCPSSLMDGQAGDAQIEVAYTPVDPSRIGTPRTKSSLE